MPRAALAVALAAALVPLAGCTGGSTAPTLPLPTATTGAGGNATQELAALPWQLGESWDQAFHFGAGDAGGIPIKAIVVARDATGFQVATDDNETAALDAAFFFQTLGWFRGPGGLGRPGVVSVQQGAHAWPWYRFPLRGGDSWQATMDNVDDGGAEYRMELRANVTALGGGRFGVELRSLEGGLVARYDYDPQMHWFTTAEIFDYRHPVPAPDAPRFRIVNSGHSMGWNGTWWEATATVLANRHGDVAPPAPPTGEPTYTFAMAAEHTHLLAFPYAYANGGAWATGVVAPDGRHYEVPAYAVPGGSAVGSSLFVPGAAGEWRVVSQGAAATSAGGGILAYGVQATAHAGVGP